jgi:hypothetical protein
MYNDYTCEKLHKAKQRDFMDEAAGARLLKQVEAQAPAGPSLKRVAALGMAGMIVIPPIAVLLSWAILGATPPWLAVASGALCLGGVYLVRRD